LTLNLKSNRISNLLVNKLQEKKYINNASIETNHRHADIIILNILKLIHIIIKYSIMKYPQNKPFPKKHNHYQHNKMMNSFGLFQRNYIKKILSYMKWTGRYQGLTIFFKEVQGSTKADFLVLLSLILGAKYQEHPLYQ